MQDGSQTQEAADAAPDGGSAPQGGYNPLGWVDVKAEETGLGVESCFRY